jgi:hypothetical protein
MRLIQLFSAILSGLALASCASTTLRGYEGPPRPDSETALVRTRGTGGGRALYMRIVSFDTPRGEPIPVRTRSIRLTPRETCLGVQGRRGPVVNVCFEPDANHHYELRRARGAFASDIEPEPPESGGPRLLLRDLTTREIVTVVMIPRASAN